MKYFVLNLCLHFTTTLTNGYRQTFVSTFKLLSTMDMNTRDLVIIRQRTQAYWFHFWPKVKIVLLKATFLFLIFILLSNQEISFHIHIGSPEAKEQFLQSVATAQKEAKASFVPIGLKWWDRIRADKDNIGEELNLANTATAVGAALTPAQQQKAAEYSNLGFIMNPNYATKRGIASEIVAYKLRKCLDYIELYKETAQEEARLFGIPAAITLAQGLLESNAGDSRLASKDNNHFGIKCKAKCKGCRCANYTDDSKYDMFRVFDSPWYSFREHSNLLTGSLYKHLLELPRSDYENWAHGLEAAGYATDKQYAEKLIKLIQNLNLQRYDL